MIEEYMSDSEYQTHFAELRGLRSRIARDLPIRPGMRVLDVGTGEGFFAMEIAKLFDKVKIVGIDISQSIIKEAIRNVKKQNLQGAIEVVEMDATSMRFPKESFDMAVDFTGLEDVHMTRGKSGVQQTFFEVNRILKPNSYFCFVEMPSDEMESEAQKIEVALFSYICGREELRSRDYETMLKKANFKITERRSYYSCLKFTPQQAKNEIRHVIKRVPEIYGIPTPDFKEVWVRFGQKIEKYGLGCYSKVVLMFARKVEDI